MEQSHQTTTSAQALCRDALVWDAHSCMPLLPGVDLSGLARYRDSGINYVCLNVGMDMNPVTDVIRVLAHFRSWLRDRPEDYVLAGSVADIRAAEAGGRLAVAFDLEGALPLAGDLAMVQLYHDLGVRQMHFAYNRNNHVGGGCHDSDIPLSAFGRALVEEINRVGLLMDCSHTGRRTSLDIMEASSKPVVFSHSNSKSLRDHARNIDSEQIEACAATGGVIGINGIGLLLGDASTEAMVAHIDHVAQIVGASHVGIGLDFVFMPDVEDLPPGTDRTYWWPSDAGYGTAYSSLTFVEPEWLPALIDRLLAMGYSDADIRAVLGGNFMRVAEESWR
ncbi:MAG: dipeptidase [Hyphomicrobiales bacterium]|nr:dipeptidase [Hyphomicrobiales bacterium]